MDDPSEAGLGLDWARKAAQAVVAHARFMEWVDRVKPLDSSDVPALAEGESPNTDITSAMRAYGEFDMDAGEAEMPVAVEAADSVLVKRGIERAG